MSSTLNTLTRNDKVHFIGIGGVSMSGLAEILLTKNIKVSGSDMKDSSITEHLRELGVEISIGHSPSNISEDVSVIVYTAAIAKDNPELVSANNRNLPMFTRAEFLGEIMKDYKHNIAVSGTHGKTTTTSMVSHILLKGEKDPTILVGGSLDIINGYVRTGKSDYFLTEACEYKGSFLSFYPTIGIILNIDADHLDYYKDIDEIEEAFQKFAYLIPRDGYLIVNNEDERAVNVAKNSNCNTITFGIDNGDIIAKNVTFNSLGHGSFDMFYKGCEYFHVTLKVPGRHNVLNSLSAMAAAIASGIEPNHIKAGIESFGGTHRRFEFKGTVDDITVIDDYAHHPTEIKATLEACKNVSHNRLICVFQPHTYTRTYSLFKDFSECFGGITKLVLADIYAAREKDTGIVSSQRLGDAIRLNGVDCINLHSFEEITNFLKTYAKAGDMIITVGAGDINKVGEDFLKSR
ncbi:UDP-N-acetylmuramate--L-alanine ligase [Clostridium cellulovorans]|uniref:UDP-N-acetylmuramate--L-alanine ligase n=1 Tax=Clostridium cellulovorans (strain ATCC 35296 / DSM 3052 / OCM 3 / 743B) TaxID=573061 RepID=D9SKQ9_CLOC7|nr:UDP-N-acetylmuramate--L-alanine ligase [Clostridium cellulovorans]ADL53481.1 UDP-N-acetylmuramate/alanine ligase [Clostridium cellulovorans 743B]